MIGLGLGLDCFPSSSSPPPSFTDFDEINTELWYSLNPNASLVSSVSIGSGVSQITGVNSGIPRNSTQPTGANQPTYSATSLNGFPCIAGAFYQMLIADPVGVSVDGCAMLAVVETLTSPPPLDVAALGLGGGSWNSYSTGQSYDFGANPDVPLQGTFIAQTALEEPAINCVASGRGLGVAFWFASNGAWRTSWNGGTEATSSVVTTNYTPTIFTLEGYDTKLGELVVISAADSTPANIAQGISILKSRWGIA